MQRCESQKSANDLQGKLSLYYTYKPVILVLVSHQSCVIYLQLLLFQYNRIKQTHFFSPKASLPTRGSYYSVSFTDHSSCQITFIDSHLHFIISVKAIVEFTCKYSRFKHSQKRACRSVQFPTSFIRIRTRAQSIYANLTEDIIHQT